jgi:chaperonin GroEL (HSP60 family)
MNERILELADKAVEDISSGAWNISDEFCKKFAELIVRECEQVSLKNSHRDDDMGAIVARQIKEHFGVNP